MYIYKKHLWVVLLLGLCVANFPLTPTNNMAWASSAYNHISNGPAPAGPNPTLSEVWWRHGGVRLQYDALIGPMQTNSNGRAWRDPADIRGLPPLYPTTGSGSRTPNRSRAPHSVIVPKPTNVPTPAKTSAPNAMASSPTSSAPASGMPLKEAPYSPLPAPSTSHKLTTPEK